MEFLKKAIVNPSDKCIEWPFAKDVSGYGVVSIGTQRAGKVHRVAFEIAYGRPALPCALHRCDNPPCFNPLHLFEGTRQDNMADKIAKRRQRGAHAGIENSDAKLTEEQVRQIRAEYVPLSRGHGYRVISKRYGVCRATIRGIVKRLDWKHLT